MLHYVRISLYFFDLQDAWTERFSSPVMQRVDMEKFFFDMEKKFSREKRGSAIDIDIFANRVNPGSEDEMEHLEELLYKFRRTPHTVLMMPSTTFAAVRAFLEAGQTDTLMRMLDDRLNYGIFPSEASYVMMLDHFLVKENWRDAAKVGVAMTLQEEGVVPIAADMALYGLIKYALLAEKDQPWDPQAPPPKEEPEDEVKVRVKWADTGYNDEQFDLTEESHLVGKGLSYIAGKHPSPGPVEKGAKLLGLVMLEKWDKVKDLLSKDDAFAKSCVERAQTIVEANEKCADKEELVAKLQNAKTEDVAVDKVLRGRIEESVAKNEPNYVQTMRDEMKTWVAIREKELERQLQLLQAESRREAIERKRREMQEKEERLFFFEREADYETQKEVKRQAWLKKMPRYTWKTKITLKKKETVSTDYVPPTMK